MKYFFIAIFLFTMIPNVFSKEELLLQHEQMIIDSGNKSFLYDEHYFVHHITEMEKDTISVFVGQSGFSVFNAQLPYIECLSTSNNEEVFFVIHAFFAQNDYVRYLITVNTTVVNSIIVEENNRKKTMSDNDAIEIISEYTKEFISLAKAILLQEISKDIWLTSACSIQKVFQPVAITSNNITRATKVVKNWKMTKTSSGNDSIYIDMGKSKILDYTLVITEKSNGLLIARINAVIVGDSMLKIYPVQISHYGKSYWIKGNVTIVYE